MESAQRWVVWSRTLPVILAYDVTSKDKVIARAPSGPIYQQAKQEMSTFNNRIVTVIHIYPNHGIESKVFFEPEPALEYCEKLREELDPEHLIQVWDTGYKIEEGPGRGRVKARVREDDIRGEV